MGRDPVGDVDHPGVRRDRPDDGVHDADELVVVAVVGEERDGVVDGHAAMTVAPCRSRSPATPRR